MNSCFHHSNVLKKNNFTLYLLKKSIGFHFIFKNVSLKPPLKGHHIK